MTTLEYRKYKKIFDFGGLYECLLFGGGGGGEGPNYICNCGSEVYKT